MFKFLKKDKPPKNTDSVEFKRWMAKKIDGKLTRYILERGEDDVEIVIGKGGFLSVVGDELSVVCGEKTLFKAKVDNLLAWEFMSLEGVTLKGFDLIQGRERTVLAYYKYHRD
ncbi:MAG: hypothetical protein A2Y15_00455 [Clostridiales bacterium GWF2_36_10]|nr:MAG: hypothetical protein A2Y15_00455 [Clostridiales bacterium GWF2_36_10]HAN21739.1 hypothetical protein [Clostridiales bacterium]